MSRSLLCGCVLLMALLCPAVFAQTTSPSASKSAASDHPQGVDILSDTGGVDVQPYVKQILAMIYRNWTPLIPSEAKPPQSEQATNSIRFTILSDGKIGAMHLDTSTGEDDINRSCWNAITATKFPALPEAMGPKSLELRIHFYVNTKPNATTPVSTP